MNASSSPPPGGPARTVFEIGTPIDVTASSDALTGRGRMIAWGAFGILVVLAIALANLSGLTGNTPPSNDTAGRPADRHGGRGRHGRPERRPGRPPGHDPGDQSPGGQGSGGQAEVHQRARAGREAGHRPETAGHPRRPGPGPARNPLPGQAPPRAHGRRQRRAVHPQAPERRPALATTADQPGVQLQPAPGRDRLRQPATVLVQPEPPGRPARQQPLALVSSTPGTADRNLALVQPPPSPPGTRQTPGP